MVARTKTAKQRLDTLLVDRELSPTRSRAAAMVVAGQVVVNDKRIDKPGTMVATDADVRLRGGMNPYASRGGLKLAGALRRFAAAGLDVAGRVAMDIGASTGGFTDCLLQAGVTKVYAVDVGYGQLAWKLATDDRVVVLDRCNIRKLDPSQVGELVSLVVCDCSFISLAKVLPHVPPFLPSGDDASTADVVVLVKPQFEVGKGKVGKGGIVRDDALRQSALDAVRQVAVELGFEAKAHCESDTAGRTGNREFLLWLRWG